MARSSTAILAVVALVLGSAVGATLALSTLGPAAPGTGDDTNRTDPTPGVDLDDGTAAVVPFESREEFAAYVRAGNRLGGYAAAASGGAGGAGGSDAARVDETATAEPRQTATDGAGGDGGSAAAGGESGSSGPTRIGTTNVQVGGLDEPDLVKADERHFYYAPTGQRYPRPVDGVARRDVGRPEGASPPDPETHVIDASDPAAPETIAAIDASGKLFRTGDTLVVLEGDRVRGYDVSDPANPETAWSHSLNASLVTARERNGTLYLVTESAVGSSPTCPVEPMGDAATVRCSDVYHPRTQIQVDVTYTALSIDAASGDVRDAVSFVGTRDDAVVYMADDSLYVTYTKSEGRAALLGDFALNEIDDLPADVADRIREVRSYDISPASTNREITSALQEWFASLPPEERERRQRELGDEFESFVADHQRALTKTGIVRVGATGGDLSVETAGTVPGRPLNQFSLSAHEGRLRIATTIPAAGSADSENDLYVLDADSLERRGEVTGMGVDERVYAVRYVGDSAYVVTFRRIDPFHVIDLSNPDDPAVQGELKLPGFSSYLHPIGDDHVLGIGEEDGEVKAVLFDVSDPTNPTVADDLRLDSSWSEVARTHHAFTIDRRHGVFFLPAGQKGVVVDYTDGDLAVETSVSTDGTARRARYVDDYLYVFADREVVVLDETTWDRTATLPIDD